MIKTKSSQTGFNDLEKNSKVARMGNQLLIFKKQEIFADFPILFNSLNSVPKKQILYSNKKREL